MGPAILGAKTDPSGVRLRLLAADSISEDPSRSDAGNELADPQSSAATGFTPVETGLCTTAVAISDAIGVVQKPVNHRGKPGGERDFACLSTRVSGTAPAAGVSHLKRNSASCPVTETGFSADTGRLAPFRFNWKSTTIYPRLLAIVESIVP